MRIAIISDIHGNFEALQCLPRDYDELWCLGDLVNYGPEPQPVIDFVRRNAAIVLRGNHDHAVGRHEDPRCAAPYKSLAAATMAFTERVLSADDKQYLADLPLTLEHALQGVKFFLCHATPADPLFGYRPKESAEWDADVAGCACNILLAGHTHVPFVRQPDKKIVGNPGSVGQPKTGNSKACYGIWENGHFELRSYEYPVERTVEKIRSMGLASEINDQLVHILRTGGESGPRAHGRMDRT
jgi:putative phosphoesterase